MPDNEGLSKVLDDAAAERIEESRKLLQEEANRRVLENQAKMKENPAKAKEKMVAAAGGLAKPTPKREPKTPEGITVFHCPDCHNVGTDDSEFPPLWECSNDNCGQEFVSEDRACESCNRPFSRKNAEHACESCQVEVEEVVFHDVSTVVETMSEWVREAAGL